MSSRDNVSKWRKRFQLVGWLVGGAGVAVIIGVIPFLSPALRKVVLPYVPATPTQLSRVVSLLGSQGTSKRIIDIGSGDGRIVLALAKEGHKAVGVELNLWLVLWSRLLSLYHRVDAKFYWKDLWKTNLSPYDTVIIFGVEDMMKPLGDKVLSELKPGSQLIACRFPVPHWRPHTTYCDDGGPNSIWLYKI